MELIWVIMSDIQKLLLPFFPSCVNQCAPLNAATKAELASGLLKPKEEPMDDAPGIHEAETIPADPQLNFDTWTCVP